MSTLRRSLAALHQRAVRNSRLNRARYFLDRWADDGDEGYLNTAVSILRGDQ